MLHCRTCTSISTAEHDRKYSCDMKAVLRTWHHAEHTNMRHPVVAAKHKCLL